MAMTAADPGRPAQGSPLSDGRLALAIITLAVAQQSIGHQNFDNSWLMTLAERVLDGKAAYVDFIESNPPASFLIYLPAVAFARLIGASVEFMAAFCMFAGGAAAILLTGAILRRAQLLKPAEAGFFLNVATFILLFLPGFSFAQREHFAVICILPLLAVHCARASGAPCLPTYAILAGLLAGAAICIKPHFGLAVLFPLVFVLVRRRLLSPVFAAENWAASGVCFGYVLLLVVKFRAYFDVLRMFLDIYVAAEVSTWMLLIYPWSAITIIFACGLLLASRKEGLRDMAAAPLCAAAGFLLAYFIQGKGFPNHGLPCVSFAGLAICAQAAPALTGSRPASYARLLRVHWAKLIISGFTLLGVTYLFGAFGQFSAWEEHPGLDAAIRRQGLANPRMIAVSTQFHIGFPAVRHANGVWVGRSNGLWIMSYAQDKLDEAATDEAYRGRMKGYIDVDARRLLEDVRKGNPDLILVDSDDMDTARALLHPDVAATLEGYAPLEKVEHIWLWGRKP